MLLLVTSAAAHPFGDRFAAVWIRVDVHPKVVDVHLVADVPAALAAGLTRDISDPERFLEVVPSSVHLEVNGAPCALRTVQATHEPDLVTGHAEIYSIQLSCDARAPIRDLRLRHGLLAATPVWLRADLTVSEGFTVQDTSLDPSDRDHRDLLGRWTRSRKARDLTVQLSAPPAPIGRALAASARRIDGRDARPMPWWNRWLVGRRDAPTLAIATLIAFVLPFASRRPSTVASVAAGALAAAPLLWLAPPQATYIAVVVVGLVLTHPTFSPALLTAGALAWIVTSLGLPAGCLGLGGFFAGVVISRSLIRELPLAVSAGAAVALGAALLAFGSA